MFQRIIQQKAQPGLIPWLPVVLVALLASGAAAAPAWASGRTRFDPVVRFSSRSLPAKGGALTIHIDPHGGQWCRIQMPKTQERPFRCRRATTRTLHIKASSTGFRERRVGVQIWRDHPRRRRKRSFSIREGIREAENPGKLAANVRQAEKSSVPAACSPGPECDLGPGRSEYPGYGDVGAGAIGDCTFAAAADYEQLAFGVEPEEAAVIADFYAAGGGVTNDLTAPQLFEYWESAGIAGVRAAPTEVGVSPAALRAAVLANRAVLAGVSAGALGDASTSGHMLVVDGFTPEGPLLLTWGETELVSWSQWEGIAIEAWVMQPVA